MSTQRLKKNSSKYEYTINASKELIVSNNYGEKYVIPLIISTEDCVFIRRLKNIPTFVLKINRTLYVADIDRTMSLRISSDPSLNIHKCYECEHCRALIEELGGCSKVRDCDPRFYSDTNGIIGAIDLSKRIEKYDFIKFGYETIGTNPLTLGVIQCEHFMEYSPRKKIDPMKSKALRLSLIGFLYDYIQFEKR